MENDLFIYAGGGGAGLLIYLATRAVGKIDENIKALWAAINSLKDDGSEAKERLSWLEARHRPPR